jgi:hypothetical protein
LAAALVGGYLLRRRAVAEILPPADTPQRDESIAPQP